MPKKLRITYKNYVDGFQCDCIADDGCTFTFYFHNKPTPKKWIDKGYSPLRSHCMALFDCFVDEYHQFRFNNLYISAKFSLGLCNHPKKLMIEGVSRTSSRGVPMQILQQEVTTQ